MIRLNLGFSPTLKGPYGKVFGPTKILIPPSALQKSSETIKAPPRSSVELKDENGLIAIVEHWVKCHNTQSQNTQCHNTQCDIILNAIIANVA